MADLLNFTIDERPLQAKPGTLVIEAARQSSIEVPAFCYVQGYSLQAACRMCLVEVEKMPKLQTACTLPVSEGMIVRTDSPTIHQARKGMIELLLTNHPLDCPVCDKGGECELQDMTFRYGAGESRFAELKQHADEKQFSPVVYFDEARCILCYRCVRVCNEGMGVGALGVVQRGVGTAIAPSHGDHLECDECGACIDICPVGALTSGAYRYKTRPWEMKHVSTVCTHCSNGCKPTLGVRNDQIIRANNRDQSGLNGEFLCVKGRYGFDFVDSPERLQSPLVKVNGKLEPVSWSKALKVVAAKFNEIRARGGKFGTIGSNRTSNEENYFLQKFAREVLGTENIDHHRTGDLPSLFDALTGRTDALASVRDLYTTPAALVIGADLSQQHPLLAFQLRANFRHNKGAVYTITEGPVRERKYGRASLFAQPSAQIAALEQLRAQLAGHPELVILFGDTIKGQAIRELVQFGDSLGIRVRYVPLVDYSNSRGAADMGLMPGVGPGYQTNGRSGLTTEAMISASDLDALWIVGANPFARQQVPVPSNTFLVVHDLFLTETAQRADVVFPAASGYEKEGTVTNVTGEIQRLRKAIRTMGSKPDLEIFTSLAREMGLADWAAAKPETILEEIRSKVHGYNVSLPVIMTGGAAQAIPLNGRVAVETAPELIFSSRDTLFTSGSLGRYSKALNSVLERDVVRLYDSGRTAP